jgi:hypothetical protein
MARPTSTQLVGLITALSELHVLGSVAYFPTRVLSVVGRVIGCDSASYNEIDILNGSRRVLAEPYDAMTDELDQAFGTHLHEHPVIAHYAATGDVGSRMISDFLRPRELHCLGLYADLFAPLGIEAQLSFTMPTVPATSIIGIALNRGKPGFNEPERTLLDLLRPHILIAYTNSARGAMTSWVEHPTPDSTTAASTHIGDAGRDRDPRRM